MKKIFLIITYVLLFLFCINNLFGQKTDSIINNDTLKRHDNSLNIGVVVSPLIHTINMYHNTKDIFSLPTGFCFSSKLANKSIIGIETGLLFDFKRYNVEYVYFNKNPIKFNYNYVYIPILININLTNSYISFGGTIRRPVCFPLEYKKNAQSGLPNPYAGFQVGFGNIIPLNKRNLVFNIEPYLLITGKGQYYYTTGQTSNILYTKSYGLLIGINLQIVKKIKF